jgi:MFS family permease
LGALVSVVFLVPTVQKRRRTGIILSLTVAASGLAFLLVSLTRSPAAAIVAFFLSGIPVPIVLTTTNGLLQVLSPNNMRARLLTLYLMFSFGLQPIANLWVGWVAQHLGAPTAIRINGLSMFLAGLLILLRPGLRTWVPISPPVRHERKLE